MALTRWRIGRPDVLLAIAIPAAIAVVGCDTPLDLPWADAKRVESAKVNTGSAPRADRTTNNVRARKTTPIRTNPTVPESSPDIENIGEPTVLADSSAIEVDEKSAPVVESETACGQRDIVRPRANVVVRLDAPAYVAPRELEVPLATIAAGTRLPIMEAAGEWILVRFDDRRWGPRVGYLHCSRLAAIQPATASFETGGDTQLPVDEGSPP